MRKILNYQFSTRAMLAFTTAYFIIVLLVYIALTIYLSQCVWLKKPVTSDEVAAGGAWVYLHSRKVYPFIKRKILGRK